MDLDLSLKIKSPLSVLTVSSPTLTGGRTTSNFTKAITEFMMPSESQYKAYLAT